MSYGIGLKDIWAGRGTQPVEKAAKMERKAVRMIFMFAPTIAARSDEAITQKVMKSDH
jgi:hypothetical protein